jgi:methionyl-tRNA formyltransferase
MRIAIVGQQKFGKSVLDAFLARGDTVAGVFCAPEKPGSAADPLRTGAEERGIRVFQLGSLKTGEASEALAGLKVDLGVMAYVLQFAPQEFCSVPRHGMIQYHPSLLPKYRGPSSINWPIIRGDTLTGLTIFRPSDGLDEGPVLLQKEMPIGPDDTLGSVYFDRLFPMGIEALQEAADLVVGGRATAAEQDESQASYEGWCRDPEAAVNWHQHIDQLYNLVRGCNPAPGAWTLLNGKRVRLFEARKHLTRTFSQVKGKIGTIAAIGEKSMLVNAQGGQLEIFTLRFDDGKKLAAPEFCRQAGIAAGAQLGA